MHCSINLRLRFRYNSIKHMPDRPLTFTTNFSSSHTRPKPINIPKSLIPTRVAWRLIITARQIKRKFQKRVKPYASPGGRVCTARRFLPRNPEIAETACTAWRLRNSPPGGFWKISRNSENQ